jgi:cytochrome b561
VPPHHSGPTRFLHGALAIAVGVQLLSGLIMQAPSARHAGNSFFTIHEDSDIIVAALALMFWVVVATRRIGTDAGLLFPWFTAARRAAFAADACRNWAALRHGRLAGFQRTAPLGAASHGLGLLFVTAMAATGISHGIAGLTGASDTSLTAWLQWLHGLTGILVWLFLIGHGLMALLHHYAGEQDLQTIWSIGSGVANGGRRDEP